MIGFIVVAAFVVLSQGRQLEASWKYCTGQDAIECPMNKYGNITDEIIPKDIPIGTHIHICDIHK